MALSETQLQRVRRMVRDEWGSPDELWQFFDTVTDAEELHLYADGFNWDVGVEALRQLDAEARVIVFSQFTDPEYVEQARRAGAIEFVNKEDMARLVDIVRGQSPLQP